jgi:ribosome-binding factor A
MQVKDPRLGMVTITDAKVTPDLREATLYYTVYGSDEERQSSAMALESAKGVLRSQVGRQTAVRYTPSLTFVADVVPETAGRSTELLAQARKADAEVHALAEGAAPAGDADPYRLPPTVVADEDDDVASGQECRRLAPRGAPRCRVRETVSDPPGGLGRRPSRCSEGRRGSCCCATLVPSATRSARCWH